jgi:hypothetical protein
VNKIEQIVHNFVGEYPSLRIPLVAAYQRLFSVIPARNVETTLLQACLPGFFFGFHDKCPWSGDGSKLLAHRFPVDKNIDQVEAGAIEVGYFNDRNYKNYNLIGSSKAWNWQQGSSLQWLGKTDKVVFNDFEHGEKVSKIYDTNENTYQSLPCHIMAVSGDGRYAITVSFERLGRGMPGYGYSHHIESSHIDDPLPNDEGLSVIDLRNKHIIKNLFNLSDIASIEKNKQPTESYHFFSHCLFSPSSQRFVFFHRLLKNNATMETRMFSSDLHGNNIWKFPGRHFSHIAWADETRVLAFCKPPRKKLGFYIMEEFSDKSIEIGNRALTSDGHPQVSLNGKQILVDTYPDRRRNQSLKIYDIESETCRQLIRYRIPFKYRYARRCDFHPRWSRDNRLICFDSAHNNIRSLCVIQNPFFT